MQLGEFVSACRIKRLFAASVIQAAGGDPAMDRDVEPYDELCLLLAHTLDDVGVMEADARNLFLSTFSSGLKAAARKIRDAVETGEPVPVYNVGVADRRFATMTAEPDFLCLATGERIQELPTEPLETITYSCTKLLRKARERKDAAEQTPET